MVITFYILVFLAIWHFFYESVIANSLRHGLRYKFFKLRDELRRIKIDSDLSKKDEQIYDILDNSICQMIHSMSFISIGNYYRLKKEIGKNTKVQSDIDNVQKFIETADNDELKRIDQEIGLIGGRALVINNGGWTVYLLIPLLIVSLVAIFSVQFDRLTRLITKVSSKLIYSSDINDNSQFA